MACFLSNIFAKYYENPTMLSRVTAKNVGHVFLRHSVYMDSSETSWRRVLADSTAASLLWLFVLWCV